MRTASVDLGDVARQRTDSRLAALMKSQPFWVLVAIVAICVAMSFVSETFLTERNFYNITRNFAFFGIMALGMTAVIATGGIDLSVGSLMGLCGIVTGLVMAAGLPIYLGFLACMGTAAAAGLINGWLIAHLKLAPFVVTLGMLAIARSIGMVLSNNKMIYQFGPDQDLFEWIGGADLFGIPNPVWVLVVLTAAFWFLFNHTTWGRWVFAIGGNEQAARLTGIPVERIKISVYVVSALCAGLAAFLLVGWFGSVTNDLGRTYELNVIAATVIGGANLAGGAGSAIGGPLGAALVEVIRNSLLLAGVDPLWQGTFVGSFIILAVLLERTRGRGNG